MLGILKSNVYLRVFQLLDGLSPAQRRRSPTWNNDQQSSRGFDESRNQNQSSGFYKPLSTGPQNQNSGGQSMQNLQSLPMGSLGMGQQGQVVMVVPQGQGGAGVSGNLIYSF